MCHIICLEYIQGWLLLGHSAIQLGGIWRKYLDIQAMFSSENGFVYAGTSLRKTLKIWFIFLS